MTDLRARLADALANHQGICDGHTTTECWCGEEDSVRGNGIEWAEHAADVLLSLDGIAVMDAERFRRHLFDLLKGIIDGEWGPYEDDHYWLMVDEFMAAANATEHRDQ